MTTWAARADARRRTYRDEAEVLRARAGEEPVPAALAAADRALGRAGRMLAPRVRWWPWWHRGDREDVWQAIHDAEVHLQAARDLPAQVAAALEHAYRDLAPDVAARHVARLEREATPDRRAAHAMEVIKLAHAASDRRIATLHGRTRLLWAMAAAAGLAAVASIVAQALVADPFLPAPRLADGSTVAASPAALLGLVAACGAVGGLLRATADSLGSRERAEVRWFDPAPARAALTVVTGAWFGVVGVLAVATGFLVAEYTSVGAVLLLAILFGYGQTAVTRRLDRRVRRLLDDGPGGARSATGPGAPMDR